MRGGDLRRAIAFAVLVVYWAAVTLGSQFAISPPGVLYDLWYSVVPGVVGLAFGLCVALYVGRWWVVIAAAVPVTVLAALELGGHIAPWHDVGPPITGWFDGGLGAVFVTTYFVVFVLPLVLGVLVRRGLGPRSAGARYGS